MKAVQAFEWGGRHRQQATTRIRIHNEGRSSDYHRAYRRATQQFETAFRPNPEEANIMIKQELELFLHGQGAKPRSIFATRTETLCEALSRTGMITEGADEILVFVGECEEALAEPDDVEDGADLQVPVDISLTVEVLEIERHRHVHCHTCHHVAVEIDRKSVV